MPHKWT